MCMSVCPAMVFTYSVAQFGRAPALKTQEVSGLNPAYFTFHAHVHVHVHVYMLYVYIYI